MTAPVSVARPDAVSRIVFLTRRLTFGGAERQLVLLARALRARGQDVHVVVMYGAGELEEGLRRSGVPLHVLGKRGRWDLAGFGLRLLRVLRELRPAVLHGYLPVDNLLALAMRPLLPPMRLIWGVRASDIDMRRYDRLSRLSVWLERALAAQADVIIANSNAGRDHAVRQGFPAERIVVIPNGIDTESFRPDPDGRRRVRAEWEVADDERLVGIVGRLDPMKDHRTFLGAAARIARVRDDVQFVVVGRGPDETKRRLVDEGAHLGLEGRVRWTGARDDAPAVFNALDLVVSSSAWGEGFPNVLAEALSCGTPVVATDVGDSRLIVGESGRIVPPGDPEALAAACLRVLAHCGFDADAAHRGIVDRFGVERLVSGFLACLPPSA